MKRLTIVVTMFLLCLTFATCQAIPQSEISLGGITIGMNKIDVQNIYGEPTKISYRKIDNLNAEDWLYGDSFEIIFVGDSVDWVSTTANNGIATPSGLTVGTTMFDVRRYYGQTYDNYPYYTYYKDSMEYYLYSMDHGALTIDFGVKDGKVCSILIYSAA